MSGHKELRRDVVKHRARVERNGKRIQGIRDDVAGLRVAIERLEAPTPSQRRVQVAAVPLFSNELEPLDLTACDHERFQVPSVRLVQGRMNPDTETVGRCLCCGIAVAGIVLRIYTSPWDGRWLQGSELCDACHALGHDFFRACMVERAQELLAESISLAAGDPLEAENAADLASDFIAMTRGIILEPGEKWTPTSHPRETAPAAAAGAQ